MFCASTGISSSLEAEIRFLCDVPELQREGQQSKVPSLRLGHSLGENGTSAVCQEGHCLCANMEEKEFLACRYHLFTVDSRGEGRGVQCVCVCVWTDGQTHTHSELVAVFLNMQIAGMHL